MPSSTSVPVARSTTVLTSQANGGAQIYWSGQTSYLAFQACVSIFLNMVVVLLSNAKWRLRGQYTLDGVVWQNVSLNSGYIDGLSAASTTTGPFTNQYIGPLAELQGQFRVGVEITGADAATQGSAQIILDTDGQMTALPQSTRLLSGSIAASTPPVIIDTSKPCYPFSKGRVTVQLAANAPDVLTVYFKTGKSDALVSATSGTIAAGDRELSLEVACLSDYVAIYYKTAGGWSTTSATVDLVLRA